MGMFRRSHPSPTTGAKQHSPVELTTGSPTIPASTKPTTTRLPSLARHRATVSSTPVPSPTNSSHYSMRSFERCRTLTVVSALLVIAMNVMCNPYLSTDTIMSIDERKVVTRSAPASSPGYFTSMVDREEREEGENYDEDEEEDDDDEKDPSEVDGVVALGRDTSESERAEKEDEDDYDSDDEQPNDEGLEQDTSEAKSTDAEKDTDDVQPSEESGELSTPELSTVEVSEESGEDDESSEASEGSNDSRTEEDESSEEPEESSDLKSEGEDSEADDDADGEGDESNEALEKLYDLNVDSEETDLAILEADEEADDDEDSEEDMAIAKADDAAEAEHSDGTEEEPEADGTEEGSEEDITEHDDEAKAEFSDAADSGEELLVGADEAHIPEAVGEEDSSTVYQGGPATTTFLEDLVERLSVDEPTETKRSSSEAILSSMVDKKMHRGRKMRGRMGLRNMNRSSKADSSSVQVGSNDSSITKSVEAVATKQSAEESLAASEEEKKVRRRQYRRMRRRMRQKKRGQSKLDQRLRWVREQAKAQRTEPIVPTPVEEYLKVEPEVVDKIEPLQVLRDYISWHSADAIATSWDQRKYIVLNYNCPHQVGNVIGNFLNNFLIAIVTNRTLVYKYDDDCGRAPEEACERIITRAPWIASLDSVLGVSEDTRSEEECIKDSARGIGNLDKAVYGYDQAKRQGPTCSRLKRRLHRPGQDKSNNMSCEEHVRARPRLARHLADRVGLYRFATLLGQVTGCFHSRPVHGWMGRFNLTDPACLHYVDGMFQHEIDLSRVERLFSNGPVFAYGMLLEHSFSFTEELLESVPMDRVMPESDTAPAPFSIGIHVRHIKEEDDGSNIASTVNCVHHNFFANREKGNCQVLIMSDRPATINGLRSTARNTWGCEAVTVQPEEDESVKHVSLRHRRLLAGQVTNEHGPFAGAGFYQDLALVSHARSGLLAPSRSSSRLILEGIVYHQLIDAVKHRGGEISQLEKLVVCDGGCRCRPMLDLPSAVEALSHETLA